MDRRAFLSAAAGFGALAFSPETLLAAQANSGDWTLGFADVEADIAPRQLRLVRGRPPEDLEGQLFRNGPAKFRRPGGSATHWFDGDGLVRRYRIGGGRAQLSARFPDTAKRRADSAADAVVSPGFGTRGTPAATVRGPDDVNAANTSVMMAGQELWALWEGGSPVAMDPQTLATKGVHTFRADLKGMPFLAHPRYEPDGRVWNLGVSGKRAVVWRLGADGALEAVTPIELPRASYLHDFTATARHLVIVLQPWIHERQVAPISAGYIWKPEQGTQVLVLDKADLTKQRVFELPAFAFFHMGDAWEEADGTIRFDICTAPSPHIAVNAARDFLLGQASTGHTGNDLSLVALRADGSTSVTKSGLVAEFPRSDPRRAGERRDLSVSVWAGEGENPLFQGIAVVDWRRDRIARYDFGARHLVEEMVFVPRPGASAELAGWLVGTTVNLDAQATELHVFDARRVAAGPLCTWRADVALPISFHGIWV